MITCISSKFSKFSKISKIQHQNQQSEASLKLSSGEEGFPAKNKHTAAILISEKLEIFKTGISWLPTPPRIGLCIQSLIQCLLLPQWIQQAFETYRILSSQLDTVGFISTNFGRMYWAPPLVDEATGR